MSQKFGVELIVCFRHTSILCLVKYVPDVRKSRIRYLKSAFLCFIFTHCRQRICVFVVEVQYNSLRSSVTVRVWVSIHDLCWSYCIHRTWWNIVKHQYFETALSTLEQLDILGMVRYSSTKPIITFLHGFVRVLNVFRSGSRSKLTGSSTVSHFDREIVKVLFKRHCISGK